MTKAIITTALVAVSAIGGNAQILINELMQSNIDCIMDDLNEFPDSWVELYNNSDQGVSIKDYTLSLNEDGSEGYVLPETVLIPHGYLVVYCDKEGTGLHADFRIDSGKGGLYLFNANGEKADGITMKKQPAPNIAYGRVNDGSEEWGYQLKPSPGKSNTGEVSSKVLGEPKFSQAGGVWKEKTSLSIELSLPEDAPEDAMIRYTFNGKEPSLTEGYAYVTPIQVSTSTTIRAKVIADGYLSIPSTVQSYLFLGREQKIPVISLTIDPSYLYDDEIGIFVEGKGGSDNPNYNYNWRRPMNVEYFPVNEDAAINQLGEMRVQGGWTRQSSELKSVALYANKRFGTKRFNYEFWPTDKPGITDNKSFVLRHGGNDFGFGYFRDALCQRMMARYTDMDWQGYSPTIVFLNGQYHAMLGQRERSNEDNIYSNYDGLEDIDMFENWEELKEGTWDNYNAFKEFYGEANGHEMDEWREWMDVEEFTDMMILASWVINDDFPHNNIVMWRPRAGGGKWRWILKDFDFGLGIWDSNEHKYYYNYFDWIYQNTNYDATRLYRRLMLNDEYKKLYVDRWIAHNGDFLTSDNARALLAELKEENQGELRISDQKWGFSWHSLDYEWDTMDKWITRRANYLPTLVKKHFGLGTAVEVSINQDLSDAEVEDLQLTYAGVPLYFPRFKGKDFMGRSLSLSSEGVKGWKVVIGTEEPVFYEGTSMEMAIETGAPITINAVLDNAGIQNITSDNKGKVRLEGTTGIVYTDGELSICDLQGRFIGKAKSAYQLPSRGCYIVNSQKVVW